MTKQREIIPQSIRFEVFRRDDFTCRYCGSVSPDATLHVDHVHPVAAGGTDSIDNFVTACSDCNFGKSAKTGVTPPPFKSKTESAVSSHPLANLYGHTLTEDGEYRYQFKILGPVDASQQLFAVCLYSCDDDRDTSIGFIDLADLIAETKCALYASHREWRFKWRNSNHGRTLRHKRARGEDMSYKPGTGLFYNTPEEMSERVRRDDEERADALHYGKSVYPW